MILDKLKNVGLYTGVDKSVGYILRILKQGDFAKTSPGRYEFEDKGVFYLVQEYETMSKDAALFEAHRKYIDVQYIIKGSECIGYRNVSDLDGKTPYDKDKDIGFYIGEGDFLTLRAGEFCVLYPEDAHMPCISPGMIQKVKKVCFKIPY